MISRRSHPQRHRSRWSATLLLILIGAFVFVGPAVPGPTWAQDDGSDPGIPSDPAPVPTVPGVPTTVPGVPTTLPGTVTTLPGTVTTFPGTATTLLPAGGTPTSSPATVTPASVAPGQAVTVSGSGFMASQSLSVTLDTAAATPASTVATPAGAFSVVITVPGTITAGSHSVTVTGRNPQGAQHQTVGNFSVTLAQTGAGETIAMTVAGLVLVGLGYRLVEHVRWTRAVSTTPYRPS